MLASWILTPTFEASEPHVHRLRRTEDPTSRPDAASRQSIEPLGEDAKNIQSSSRQIGGRQKVGGRQWGGGR